MAEDSYTLKEMVSEVRDRQEQQGHMLTRTAATLENIELLFKKMTEQVSDHEKRLVEQEGFRGKAIMVWGVIVFILTTVANKVLANISL